MILVLGQLGVFELDVDHHGEDGGLCRVLPNGVDNVVESVATENAAFRRALRACG